MNNSGHNTADVPTCQFFCPFIYIDEQQTISHILCLHSNQPNRKARCDIKQYYWRYLKSRYFFSNRTISVTQVHYAVVCSSAAPIVTRHILFILFYIYKG